MIALQLPVFANTYNFVVPVFDLHQRAEASLHERADSLMELSDDKYMQARLSCPNPGVASDACGSALSSRQID
eukprot:scaffold154947_cov19-Prasinocladus_malaysianus.AAC.1